MTKDTASPRVPTTKVSLILARTAQLKPNAPTIVIIDPQYADFEPGISDALTDLLGHTNHAVLPIPLNAIKFYQVQPTERIEVNTTPINLDLGNGKS